MLIYKNWILGRAWVVYLRLFFFRVMNNSIVSQRESATHTFRNIVCKKSYSFKLPTQGHMQNGKPPVVPNLELEKCDRISWILFCGITPRRVTLPCIQNYILLFRTNLNLDEPGGNLAKLEMTKKVNETLIP